MRTYILTCVDEDSKVTMEINGHLCFDELAAEFRKFSVAVGYHPETVEMYISEDPVIVSLDDDDTDCIISEEDVTYSVNDFQDGQASS